MLTTLRRIGLALFYLSMEAFVAFLCIAAGVPMLIDPSFAPLILQEFSNEFIRVWASVLIVGGLLKLLGIAFGHLRIRQAGLALLGSVAMVLAIVLLLTFDPARMFGALTYFIFAAAAAARYAVLGRLMRGLQDASVIIEGVLLWQKNREAGR